MKNTLSIRAMLVLFTLFALAGIPPAQAVEGRPSAITFADPGEDRKVYAFVRGDDGHLVSNHFNGTTWQWIDHGVPPGSTSINNPKAVTYVDDVGNRRIYVFAADNSGHLVVLFHKGPGYTWQWSQQGGPVIVGASLSATTFVDDNDVRRMYVFAYKINSGGPQSFRLVTHFWNGNAWNWADMAFLPTHHYEHATFTEVTNYVAEDGRRRMDVFCAGHNEDTGIDQLMRHSWIAAAWTLAVLGHEVDKNASVVNFKNTYGGRAVHAFVWRPAFGTLWHSSFSAWADTIIAWHQAGLPPAPSGTPLGFFSAIAYRDGNGFANMNLFAERDNRLFLRPWVDNGTSSLNKWGPWVDLGRPSSAQTTGVKNPVAITYPDGRAGHQHTWVFMTGGQDHLYANYWNGTSWQWFDRGNAP